VALDLLGGDHGPGVVVAGALLAVDRWPGLGVTLVGPPELVRLELAARDAAGRLPVVPASGTVPATERPATGVRTRRDCSVAVGARLVRDGAADALVSVGPTGAVIAAGLLTFRRLPGVTRPPLAIVVPALRAPLVLLDVGAYPDCAPELLACFARLGSAYAAVALGTRRPRVGLLSNGTEPDKGDRLRRRAGVALAAAPGTFVGNVEAAAILLGGDADVVVTDGFTGNVLLKGLEGAVGAVFGLLGPAVPPRLRGLARDWSPEHHGGALLLGLDAVVVVGHGASSAEAVAGSVLAAARAVADGVLPRLTEVLSAAPGAR
jgi:glycerol-3-phosphate acyltransferase PlsX